MPRRRGIQVASQYITAVKQACDRALNLDPRLGKALQDLKQQLPNPDFNLDGDEWQFKQWWQTHGISWTEQLSAVIIKYRQIGYPWQFNSQQNKLFGI